MAQGGTKGNIRKEMKKLEGQKRVRSEGNR